MDNSIITKHWELISKHYPGMKITQLGMVCVMLGAIRSSMGYEIVAHTVRDYIHPPQLTDDVRQCLDFLERELLSLKRSKIDVDYWKRGKRGAFRRDTDKVQA